VFDALPLAALVNDAVFLCHGGISPDLGHPRDINRIERPQVGLHAAGLL
jgi:serine/threonine-protein phosphatase PP1 catalytic subunit